MYKKTITYTDYNGNERTENFYFNLTQAELTEWEMGVKGGLAERIQKIVESQDQPAIIAVFKELILKAYGEKTLDGKRFRKVNDAGVPLSIAFSETEAYSNLFMELATDDKAAAEFVNGIMPSDMSDNKQE